MPRILPWRSLLVAAAMLLAGCAETLTYSEIGRGRQLQYVENFEQTNKVETADVDTAFNACRAYYELRRYNNFFSCADAFLKRFGDAEIPSLAQLRVRGRGDFVSPMLSMRAAMRMDLGELDRAVTDADQAVAIFDRDQALHAMGDTRYFYMAEALTTSGIAHARLGNRPRALKLAGDLEAINAGMIEGVFRRIRNTGMAKIQVALRDEVKAIEILERPDGKDAFFSAIDAINKVNPAWYIIAPLMIGTLDPDAGFTEQRLKKEYLLYSLYARNGRSADAAAGLDRLLAEPALSAFGELYWPSLYQRALLFIESGDLDRAVQYLKAAIEAIESQRATIPAEGAKIGFAANSQSVYATLVGILYKRGELADAFSFAERAKARALVDMLASRSNFAARGKSPAETARMIEELERMEVASRLQVASAASPTELRRTRSAAVETTRAQLKSAAPELSSLVAVESLSLADAQALLAEDEALVEYFGLGAELYAFSVTKTAIKAARIDTAGLDDDVRAFRAALGRPRDGSFMALSRALHNRLLRPFAGEIGVRVLTIVPHGPLHYVPFAALHDGDAYLIDRGALRLLPSASVLRFVKATPSDAPEELLALGNPDLGDPAMALKGAEAEAIAIAGAWPKARVLLRAQATESIVKSAGGQFRYLHFAVHGEFDPAQPLASRLLLAGDGANDGNLTADELYDLNLNADLVTLSACETGLGEVASGDDVIGLVRGFLYAGTRSVVASLWPVADAETSELMTSFYGNLRQTYKAEALRQAQIALKARHAHPFYWAAFQLTGQAR